MENIVPAKAQLISIFASFCFLAYITFLIVRGRLRAEYSTIWIVSSLILIIFSFWRSGLELLANWLGVYAGINLAFAGAIFAILIYLLHLSIVASRLSEQNKALAQQIALPNKKFKTKKLG
jgi:hypothetical protein